jgi:hypothetical protein
MSESLMPSSAGVDEHDDVVVSEEDTSNRVRRLLAAWDVATPQHDCFSRDMEQFWSNGGAKGRKRSAPAARENGETSQKNSCQPLRLFALRAA